MATINTYDEYTLCELTHQTVNILIQTFADLDGAKTQVGKNKRISYANSEVGREQVSKLLPKEYALAVFAVWGETPTVTDPEKSQEE